MGAIDETMLQKLQTDLGRDLARPVRAMRAMQVPEGSYEIVRNQYNSTRILREILREVPPDAEKVLGIIDKDLCIPILTFVFGEAQLGGIGSIVSITRLRQEFYGLKPDAAILYERLYKECLHELGHNFGLTHCRDRKCIMFLSNAVTDVDRKGPAYCEECGNALNRHTEPRR